MGVHPQSINGVIAKVSGPIPSVGLRPQSRVSGKFSFAEVLKGGDMYGDASIVSRGVLINPREGLCDCVEDVSHLSAVFNNFSESGSNDLLSGFVLPVDSDADNVLGKTGKSFFLLSGNLDPIAEGLCSPNLHNGVDCGRGLDLLSLDEYCSDFGSHVTEGFCSLSLGGDPEDGRGYGSDSLNSDGLCSLRLGDGCDDGRGSIVVFDGCSSVLNLTLLNVVADGAVMQVPFPLEVHDGKDLEVPVISSSGGVVDEEDDDSYFLKIAGPMSKDEKLEFSDHVRVIVHDALQMGKAMGFNFSPRDERMIKRFSVLRQLDKEKWRMGFDNVPVQS